jgi:RsiW-degrading membrane proteinase PrsW (M82 family)
MILVFFSVYLAYTLAGEINSFFKGVLGEEIQKKLEAPFVEELLKPLGLLILAVVLWLANRIESVRVNWLRSIKVDYTVGYVSGLTFGLLEDWLSYGTFSGFRATTPFLHAFETGILGVGIYYVLTRGKRGLVKLIPLYFAAVSLHLAWNNIGSPVALAVLGVSSTVVGMAAFLLLLLSELGRNLVKGKSKSN